MVFFVKIFEKYILLGQLKNLGLILSGVSFSVFVIVAFAKTVTCYSGNVAWRFTA